MNPISIRINELIEKLFDGNNSKFAKKIGINEANIRNYRKGTLPKVDFIIKIYENIEFNFEWLLTGKGEMLRNIQENKVDNLMAVELLEYKNKEIAELKQQLQDCQEEKKIRTDSKINV
ncbi:hypothetical protein KHA90_11795 [Flavobacterium psychroterrae]|uniref:HTH cro/C1-type domain-containing protein n=1 Tax=Flavobacterium psychroterrae TaxID=2133767 RepID=A0ABS5PBL8_9FLAO|nr:hypothetical protein [Flavobacterium psychroterrae]MBS7231709.1 hypothetical protein [Flavobacterium psychroterrae]